MLFQSDPGVGNSCFYILPLENLRYLLLRETHMKSLAWCGEEEVMLYFLWWILVPLPCFTILLVEIWLPDGNKAFMVMLYLIICIISLGSWTNYTYFCHASEPKLKGKLVEMKVRVVWLGCMKDVLLKATKWDSWPALLAHPKTLAECCMCKECSTSREWVTFS